MTRGDDRPEPMRDLSDEHIEDVLRAALRARAESTDISGTGLATIRDRIRRRTRTRVWRPALAAVGAAAVIVAAAVLPHALSGNGHVDNATATSRSAHGSPAAPGQASESSPRSAGRIIGTPVPISSDTPTMYPMGNTAQAAAAMEGDTQGSPSATPALSPEEVAESFVTAATSGAAGDVTTSAATSSTKYVAGSNGAIVKVYGATGDLITVVYLRPLTVKDRIAYVVIGASLPGGDANAQLTIDAPQVGSQVVVGGKLRGDLRASSSTLSTAVLSSNDDHPTTASTPTSIGIGTISSATTWTMSVQKPARPVAVVTWASDSTGAITGLVGTTIG